MSLFLEMLKIGLDKALDNLLYLTMFWGVTLDWRPPRPFQPRQIHDSVLVPKLHQKTCILVVFMEVEDQTLKTLL